MPNPALSAILADLERHKTIFDLDKGLGERLMDATAEVILRDMEAEVDPDGQKWAPLSEAYVEYKSRAAPGAPMAVLTGAMKSEENVRGLRRIATRECVMVFGTTEEARDHAEKFQEGGPRQAPRRFYAISSECEARLDRICQEQLEAMI